MPEAARHRALHSTTRNGRARRESQHVTDTSELVERAQAGDREAFNQLVRITHSDAYALAFRLTGNSEDAGDVVQEAYLRAYRGVGRFRGEAQFSTWLYRIVANCSATQLKRRQRHRYDELASDEAVVDTHPDNDPVLQSDYSELRATLDAAIADLPPRLRAVLVLRDMYDLTHKAIASELGISVTAAKVRLHRARKRLREHVMPLPGEGTGNGR